MKTCFRYLNFIVHFNSIALLHPSLDGCYVHTPLLEPLPVEG